jgi:hypothetical protein
MHLTSQGGSEEIEEEKEILEPTVGGVFSSNYAYGYLIT